MVDVMVGGNFAGEVVRTMDRVISRLPGAERNGGASDVHWLADRAIDRNNWAESLARARAEQRKTIDRLTEKVHEANERASESENLVKELTRINRQNEEAWRIGYLAGWDSMEAETDGNYTRVAELETNPFTRNGATKR